MEYEFQIKSNTMQHHDSQLLYYFIRLKERGGIVD